ncbi:E3 ubiquitin-protein ligase rnf152-B-like [Frankliniella occidentalis]|uniref:E3 ubiquitin-protein ligase rnf152-B-like n=1 Tax=Frankliniella occidentalis TaxID=133901 RepID=A0A9C6UDU2_FRAOC|nr:E3 ubiquitin-protein ligase rnf152-B-like [Frankliniella occidentalis]
MEMGPQCDICFLDFDLDRHRPKVLPCGHTVCKACVENPGLGTKCPTCRKVSKQNKKYLIRNIVYRLMRVIILCCKQGADETFYMRNV